MKQIQIYIASILLAVLSCLFAVSPAFSVINAVSGSQQGYSDGQGGTMTDTPVEPSWSGSETLANGTSGVAYSQDLSSYVSGNYTPTCSTSSTLPTGINLSSSCVVSGTPSETGSFSITVTATNGAGSSTSATLAFDIAASATATDAFTAIAASTSQIDLTWDHTNYPDATGFAILRSPVHTDLSWTTVTTASSTADSYSDTGLSTNTEYLYLFYPIRSTGRYNYDLAIEVTKSAPANTAVVTNDSEFNAAAANTSITDIRMSGSFTSAIGSAFAGDNRTSSRVVVRPDNYNNPPVLTNTSFNISDTSGVRFYRMNASSTVGGTFFAENAGEVNNCTFAYNTLTGPTKDTTTTTESATYSSGMPNFVDLGDIRNHTNIVFGNRGTFIRQMADIRANGHTIFAKNWSKYWYFDWVRIFGVGDEDHVDGTSYFIKNTATDNIARYEEESASAPHSDFFQVISSGGTNPRVSNMYMSQNINVQDTTLRGNNVQSHLIQSPLVNIIYHETTQTTLGRPHGWWVEAPTDGVLVDHVTAVSNTGAGVVSMKYNTNQSGTNILVVDSIATGRLDFVTSTDPDLDAEILNSFIGGVNGDYSVFENTWTTSSEDTFLGSIVPTSTHSTKGPVTTDGEWRVSVHRPGTTAPPSVTGGTGQFTLDTINEPTVNGPIQEYLGGTSYTYDVRYAVDGTYSWTEQTGVSETDVIGGGVLSSGTYKVETRCVNSAGYGVWSNPVTVVVN